jgi:hypothetical protein
MQTNSCCLLYAQLLPVSCYFQVLLASLCWSRLAELRFAIGMPHTLQAVMRCCLLTAVTVARLSSCCMSLRWSRLTELTLSNVMPQAPGIADAVPDDPNDSDWDEEQQERQLRALLRELGKLTEMKVGKGFVLGKFGCLGAGCRVQNPPPTGRDPSSSSVLITTLCMVGEAPRS